MFRLLNLPTVISFQNSNSKLIASGLQFGETEGSMRIPRLLILASLILFCFAAAVAQSSPQNTEASPSLFRFELTSGSEESIALQAVQTGPSATDAVVTPVIGPHMPFHTPIDHSDVTCLSIRAYRVARVHADSDVVRPAGYSTCQPSSRFQVKTAVDSREITPR
jgi:hypothetical protein